MFVANPEVACTETDYGIVLLDKRSGKYWNLNTTGALVWRSILETGGLDHAVSTLLRDYNVEHETVIADVHNVAAKLTEAGVITNDRVSELP